MVCLKKYIHHSLLCTLAFSLLIISNATAQRRVSYQDLVMKQRSQHAYFDIFTLPGNSDNTVQFASTFRIDYSFLPFRKMNNYGDKERFFSPVSLSMEVFEAEEKVSDPEDRVSIEGLNTVNRSFWRDTAYAESYQQTNSNNTFIVGSLQTELKPGLYNYLLQLNRSDGAPEERSRAQQVEIYTYGEKPKGNVIFVQDLNNKQQPSFLRLLSFGGNVNYGRDFHALVHLPNYAPQAEYYYRVSRFSTPDIKSGDTEQIDEQPLSENNFLTNIRPKLTTDKEAPGLRLNQTRKGHSYALFHVPNSEFPNDTYRLEVLRKGEDQPIARTTFRSLWLQMPASLLNLDVAIDMLRFIEKDEVIEKLKSGSEAEREEKFREYWKSKDPTPKTEYNELMAEYYRRIDYAYEQFSTVNTVGFESDQGQIYIRYGTPDNVERKFPTDAAAVEIWSYDNSQQFVFRATSGFGDFQLVEQ